MSDPAPTKHLFGRTRHDDLQLLADGRETGWWDHTGQPAPWPEDFADPDSGWTRETDPTHHHDPENPPF